eukprot:TRINITY_DN2796_c0_g1_i1.p1 TRINITY_DN2796_c0_g1~~TRINITY_DN2796_c0_g1_i1.p1  ORF type:complete len:509 (+),score=92.16 TRINITY_DN2796_c0_g1_i1:318-1844(+)
MGESDESCELSVDVDLLSEERDVSASILLELKNQAMPSPLQKMVISPVPSFAPLANADNTIDGTPMSSPGEGSSSSPSQGISTSVIECTLSNCQLCLRGQPSLLIRTPTWASIMRVVFYSLQQGMKDKTYFNLKTDVYGFMTSHWDILCLNKKRSENWHKQIQDMLSHSKNLFESGMDKYKQNGYWRMKQNVDPWTIKKERKSSAPSTPNPFSETPKSSKRENSSPLESDDEVQSVSFSSPTINITSPPNSTPAAHNSTLKRGNKRHKGITLLEVGTQRTSDSENEASPSSMTTTPNATPLPPFTLPKNSHKKQHIMDQMLCLREATTQITSSLVDMRTSLKKGIQPIDHLDEELRIIQQTLNHELDSVRELLSLQQMEKRSNGSLISEMCVRANTGANLFLVGSPRGTQDNTNSSGIKPSNTSEDEDGDIDITTISPPKTPTPCCTLGESYLLSTGERLAIDANNNNNNSSSININNNSSNSNNTKKFPLNDANWAGLQALSIAANM